MKHIACIACNGGCRSKKDEQGKALCTYGCLACGACVNACPNDAISLVDGLAQVDSGKCSGCGLCKLVCPQYLIAQQQTPIEVRCSNHDLRSKDQCEVSCIGCGLCEKNCPADAIHVVNHCAVIDEEKCLSCGACAMVCPRKVIHDRRGILT